jgi:hypothetical protein
MGRPFYLYRHKNGTIYAEIFNRQTGKRIASRSTGTRSRDEAISKVTLWLRDGLPASKKQSARPVYAAAGQAENIAAIEKSPDIGPDAAEKIVLALRARGLVDFAIAKTGPGKEGFIAFLLRFWDPGRSPYLTDRFAHGHRMTKKYYHNATQIIERHWRPFFGNSVTPGKINRQAMRDFSHSLRDKGLSASTVNNIMAIGYSPLHWARSEGMIPVDPSEGLATFTGDAKKRDILNEEEIEILFRTRWQDKRAYAAALLSLTTGSRSGEIRALRQADIAEAVIDISRSWNDTEGLKCPKNGEPRRAPLLPEVRGLLLELLAESP